MFAKLLKHEFKATAGMLGILCAACLGFGLLGGGAIRYLAWAEETGPRNDDGLLTILSVLICVTAVIVIAACSIILLLLLVNRFYKSRFTDEGYLTFTLPVTTHQNLLSSLANTAIGMVIMFFVVCAAIAVWLMIGFSGIEGFYEKLWEVFPRLWEEFLRVCEQMPWKYVGMFLLNILCGFACELVVLMLSVTIGSILAKKHKILAAVGAYYAIHVAISMVTSAMLAMQAFSGSDDASMFLRFYNGTAVLMAVISVAGYFLMYFLVDRKLNLN